LEAVEEFRLRTATAPLTPERLKDLTLFVTGDEYEAELAFNKLVLMQSRQNGS
jgi:hypothetical protein